MKTLKTNFFIFASLFVLSTQVNAQLKVLSDGNVLIPNGKSYRIGSTTDNGIRLRMHNSGNNAYLDYYNSLYFRSGLNSNTTRIDLSSGGCLKLYSATQDWWSAFQVTVSTSKSCAFNLTYNGADRFFVSAEGWLWAEKGGYFGSDIKLKENVLSIDNALSKVLKLRGVSYTYKNDEISNSKKNVELKLNDVKNSIVDTVSSQNRLITSDVLSLIEAESSRKRFGVIAQEVEEIVPDAVRTMPNGNKGVAYEDLIVLLIEAIKEQQKQIDELKANNSNIKSMSGIYSEDLTLQNNSVGILHQNVPNPFNVITSINYYIPESANKSVIYIYNLQGVQIKSFPIKQKGNGHLNISAGELNAGIYIYNLIIDGKEVDNKRMVLTN